jgi:hypothetical protein
MKSYQMKRVTLGNSRGGVLVLVALLLVVFIGIAALAVDIGQLATTKNELQNVADAAALAGAGRLGTFYMDLAPAAVPGSSIERFEIVDVVQAVALQNKASGLKVVIYDTATDIRIGHWNSATLDIDKPEELEEADAVYVKARRDDDDPTSPTSKITTFFAGIFGIDTMSVTAEAFAALSGPSTVTEGELVMPIGISEGAFPSECKDLIYFSPTTTSCAGWHNFFDPKNTSSMREKFINLIESDSCRLCGPTTTVTIDNGHEWLVENFDYKKKLDPDVATPTTSINQDFNFTGGTLATLFNGDYLFNYDGDKGFAYNSGVLSDGTKPSPIFTLFDYFRYRDGDDDTTVDTAVYDADGKELYPANHTFDKNDIWTSMVPVYKDSGVDCKTVGSNPGNGKDGAEEIVGFAKVMIIQPNAPPSKDLTVKIDCNFAVVDGRSGGGTYGNIKGTIPSLVK